MRNRYALLVFPIALIAVTTMSVTGQEDPLPAVTPRAAIDAAAAANPVRYIALAVEPIRAVPSPTLADAARRHDYVTFHALYAQSKAAGENVAAFDALHELWTWSMTDRVGAFYGTEMHARLARAYPGFTRFIEDHRIVDNRGNVFYPTSETRTFLLERALEGRAPRVLVADAPRAAERAQQPASSADREARRSDSASSPSVRNVPPSTATATAASRTNAPRAATASRAPRRAAAAPVTTSVAAAPVVAAPVNVPAPVATTPPVAATPAAAPAAAAAEPAPIASATPAPIAPSTAPEAATVPDATQPIARDGGFANRGILLLVIGIVGIGLLAVMLRTPQETTMPSILQPPAAPPAETSAAKPTDASPVAPVEPLRRPSKGGAKRAS